MSWVVYSDSETYSNIFKRPKKGTCKTTVTKVSQNPQQEDDDCFVQCLRTGPENYPFFKKKLFVYVYVCVFYTLVNISDMCKLRHNRAAETRLPVWVSHVTFDPALKCHCSWNINDLAATLFSSGKFPTSTGAEKELTF